MGKFHSSFQQTLWQLQFTIDPDTYWSLVSKEIESITVSVTPSDVEIETYWNKLPLYLIARCPLCGREYTNRADIQSLYYWRNTSPETHLEAFPHPDNRVPCAHFVGVQRFINLNGNLPVEFNYSNNRNGDIPVITPELVQHSPEASAVIHSLHVCRIENHRFVPKYSAYLITYYAESPSAARDAVLKRYPLNPGESHGSPLFCVSGHQIREPIIANLPYWVEQKKLYWLDLNTTDLTLKSSPRSEFPYAGITGFGTPWIYRKTPKPRWWQARNWSPDGEIRDWLGKRLL